MGLSLGRSRLGNQQGATHLSVWKGCRRRLARPHERGRRGPIKGAAHRQRVEDEESPTGLSLGRSCLGNQQGATHLSVERLPATAGKIP
jgi:hypothetical protein